MLVGVIFTEHFADPADPPASVHVPSGANVTVPVGVDGFGLVSVTVAVHVVGWPTVIIVGVQTRVILVEWTIVDVACLAGFVEL